MKKILVFIILIFSVNCFPQNNKDSLEYINHFLKSSNYWGSINGYLVEASPDIFKYEEYANFNNGEKHQWEAYIFNNHLKKIVSNQNTDGSILFFDFHFNIDVTVYSKEIVNSKVIEIEENKNKITIRIDKTISKNECETLKLAFKLLFKGVLFEETIY